ncbi:hypothetical protein EJB05_29201, partial [Eragrostis curvula]
MANFLRHFVNLIVGTVRGLFQHDSTTGAASVQLWAVAATVLLLLKFAVGSIGPRFSSRRLMAPSVRLLQILNYYAVNYTLGLMKPSSSSDGGAATVNAFFKVWAVLITTMQDSIRIGRPYKPKEMSLIDLLSSLWSANELRGPAPLFLKVPLWLMWSIHAARIIWFYFSFSRASDASLSNIKFVSDYMMTKPHTDNEDACPRTMRGYKYIVFREDKLKMEVTPPTFKLWMDHEGPNAKELVTVEEIWKQVDEDTDDMLLSKTADPDNRFKDVCLSFALYKLQRRRFYNFPITEATHLASRRLVSEAILEDGPNGSYERALRITEVELSFLQDLFYSKHAAVFARGFPYVRLALSLLMTVAALYLVEAVRHIPSVSTAVTGGGRVARITHGVFVTHCITAVVVFRELWEVGVYVLSQWTKVWIIGRHMKLMKGRPTRGTDGEKWYQMMLWKVQKVMLEKVARIMFAVVWRGQWDQRINQYNILMSALIRNKNSAALLPSLIASRTKFLVRKVKLRREAKEVLFQSLKNLIKSIPSPGQGKHSPDMNKELMSYFTKAFVDDPESSTSPRIEDPTRDLEGETHKVLVWHIATSLCQIKLLESAGEQGGATDLYTLPKRFGRELQAVRKHYVAAVSLSNYCTYLVTQALVPDNGLVATKVFEAVREEVRLGLGQCCTMAHIQDRFLQSPSRMTSILEMGAQLSETLLSTYQMDDDLWERLANFWARFLLHLSASTRVAKHQIHLQGRGELTTHLWLLLSHAGFLGKTSHGEKLLDPVDLNDA